MKHLAVILFVTLAAAQNARADGLTTLVGQTVAIDVAGATAAYAIDATAADVTLSQRGRIAITGRAAGSTQIIVVTAARTEAIVLTILPAAGPNAVRQFGQPASIARSEVRYSSGARQLQNMFDASTVDGGRRTQIHLFNIHYFDRAFGRSADAFPSASFSVTTPSRRLTLLDDLVDLSAVTIRTTQIRGAHLVQGPFELHAGYAAPTMYDDLFLPADRRWVAGAGYAIDRGPIRWTPSTYVFLSQPKDGAARRGGVAALTAEYRNGDVLSVRGDAAIAKSAAAAAGELTFQNEANRLRAGFAYRPDAFPTLGLTELPGGHAHFDWSGQATQRTTIDSYATFDRTHIRGLRSAVGIANFAARYHLSAHFSATGGFDASFVRSGASARTIGIPAGLSYDAARYGFAATYRLLDNSQTSRRGDIVRLSARAANRGFRVSGWLERQRQAPSLDLIFRESAGLELALQKLGIIVRSSEDLATVLRDNAALINLGYIAGVTVDLTPRRIQCGGDASYTSADGRHDVRLHALIDRTDGIAADHDSLLGSLSYSLRVLSATSVYGSYTWWKDGRVHAVRRASFDVGLRHRFSGLPDFMKSSGSIEGIVFLDPDMTGTRGEASAPVPGMVVTLDDTRSVRTDRNGAYAFRNVAPGNHRIFASLTGAPAAYFTTPSNAEVASSAHIDFGIVWSPARVIGRVTSDAAAAVAGIRIAAKTAAGVEVAAATNSEGEFTLVVPPGDATITLVSESLPSGFMIMGDANHVLHLIADAPQRVDFNVRALRSISGTADNAGEVRIEPLGRTAMTDAAGHFAFRQLPAGTFTVTSHGVTRTITLPAEPATVSGFALTDSNSPH